MFARISGDSVVSLVVIWFCAWLQIVWIISSVTAAAAEPSVLNLSSGTGKE